MLTISGDIPLLEQGGVFAPLPGNSPLNQLLFFRMKQYLTNPLFRMGYILLNTLFLYLAAVYGAAALRLFT